MTARINNTVLLTVLMLLLSFALVTPAMAAKLPTGVSLEVYLDEDDDDEFYRYIVRLEGKKKCRKRRKVIVFHDENRNGKLDETEFIIKKGRTNRKGKFRFKSFIVPPEGDTIGVIVKGTDECKKGKTSEVY